MEEEMRCLVFKKLIPVAVAVVPLTAGEVAAQSKAPTRPLAVNQTDGFAEGQVVVFTDPLSFACIAGAFGDVNKDGQPAAVQPSEFNPGVATVGPMQGQAFSHCVLGFSPALDPTGAPASGTEELFVLVPFSIRIPAIAKPSRPSCRHF
jgi:hypothetical protein